MVGKSDDNKVGNSELGKESGCFCSNWLVVSDEGTTDSLKGALIKVLLSAMQ